MPTMSKNKFSSTSQRMRSHSPFKEPAHGDPWRRLSAAVVVQAVKDAGTGDVAARDWLLLDGLYWLALSGIYPKKWIWLMWVLSRYPGPKLKINRVAYMPQGPRHCASCGCDYESTNNRQKHCGSCRTKRRSENV